MPPPFIHLRVHSEYSLLESTVRIKYLVAAAKARGMNAVALTDRGNMFGAIEFYTTAKKEGVKPILGCEVFLANDMRSEEDRTSAPLVLLAENEEGYHSLCAIVSRGYSDGFTAGTPRVDLALLRKHASGLIALSGGRTGPVARAHWRGGHDASVAAARSILDVFGPEHFFLEVVAHDTPEQREVNGRMRAIGNETGLQLVATNDVFYLDRKDAQLRALLRAIDAGKTLEDISHSFGPEADQLFFKSSEEMVADLPGFEDAIERTQGIADRCKVSLVLDKPMLPRYPLPDGFTIDSYFEKVSREGLEVRIAELGYPIDRDAYFARLDYEMKVILGMGFPGYFLIVWDFIAWAKANGCPVGPGRGSGAGSIVAWSLRITDLDPIHYALLFERFLNPERISMPDFDVDFCEANRQRVVEYVRQKYGVENVGNIITFGKLKAKAAIKACGRALGLSFAESDRLSKLVPNVLNITLKDAFAMEPRFKEAGEEKAVYQQVLDFALRVEGLNSHAGVHAAGIVIGDKPLYEYVPLYRGTDGEIVTQFDKDMVEKAGLVKFDFLGLATLTVIEGALQIINKSRAPADKVDITKIPLADSKVYDLISAGDTAGVFQLESGGFQDLLRRLRPDCFEDIVAAVALYRPGPLQSGFVDQFIVCKHDRSKVKYPHADVEPILKDTYGVMVYQEQVMLIAQKLAGFTLGQADALRKAMGKKKADLMAELGKKFVEGATAHGYDAKMIQGLFESIVEFGSYAFNKSHSAAYALVTYQTAWLKTHFPREFVAALLTSEKDDSDKLARYAGDARQMKIAVLPPSVNVSEHDFSVEPGGIRFGLAAVKGVGEGTVEAVLEARTKAGPFRGLFDFCERVDSKRANRKVLEALVKAGAFDYLSLPRAALFGGVEAAIERGQGAQRDRAVGQRSLFGGASAKPKANGAPVPAKPEVEGSDLYPRIDEWSEKELLRGEKEVVGLYVSRHPLDGYASEIRRHTSATCASLVEKSDGEDASIAGVVVGLRERPLKSGAGRMAIATVEDLTGSVEAVFFSKAWEKLEAVVTSDEPLILKGRVRIDGGSGRGGGRGGGDDDGGGGGGPEVEVHSATLVVEDVRTLSATRAEQTRLVEVAVPGDALGGADARGRLDTLRTVLRAHTGRVPVALRIEFGEAEAIVELPKDLGVVPSADLIARLARMPGGWRVTLR